jgi:hypothetical protein
VFGVRPTNGKFQVNSHGTKALQSAPFSDLPDSERTAGNGPWPERIYVLAGWDTGRNGVAYPGHGFRWYGCGRHSDVVVIRRAIAALLVRIAAWLLRGDDTARLAAEHKMTARIAGWPASVGAMLASRGINPAKALGRR